MQYTDKLDGIESRFEELTRQMADPEIISDNDRYRKTAKQQSELGEVVAKYREWKKVNADLEGARQMLQEPDAELQQMAAADVEQLGPELERIENELKLLMLPKDPNDEKNVVLEIRKGTGGDEASLFAAELFRMYLRYAETKRWKVEVTSASDSEVGGVNEVIALISGDKVYSQLKYESGVHRVQRVPETEQQGRVHTSAVTVAVLPEADEVEIHIDPKDVRIDTFCSSGPGGQSVNTTYSAVRMTHLPTGVVVSCQDEKSQIKNRAKAERVMRSRLYELELEKQHAAIGAERKSMVGSGDRSEKIRTYNFPQNRLTDHRIGLTLHQLDLIMQGKLEQVLDAVTNYFQTEKMKQIADGQQNGVSNHKRGASAGTTLLEQAGVPAARLTAEVLLAHSLRKDRVYLFGHATDELTELSWIHFGRYLHQRMAGQPTQYITGVQEFFGRDFKVSPAVLIPRPETEHLVAAALDRVVSGDRVLDVGCGSGAIAVTIALESRACVWATDVSHAALEVAKGNARRLAAPVQFVAADLLTCVASASLQMVVSNPPYIALHEAAEMQREVVEHEPHLALFSGKTGNEAYARLIEQSRVVLQPGGWLLLELGWKSLEPVKGMLGEGWRHEETVADLAGIPRVLVARWMP